MGENKKFKFDVIIGNPPLSLNYMCKICNNS